MEVLAKLAVISNAFLIAFTSDFIQKLVYKFHYGEVGKESFEKLPNLKRLGRWLATWTSPFPELPTSIGWTRAYLTAFTGKSTTSWSYVFKENTDSYKNYLWTNGSTSLCIQDESSIKLSVLLQRIPWPWGKSHSCPLVFKKKLSHYHQEIVK